ncbi:MAG: hypothetical protein JW864_18990 [Spirochaetes bacterium]|nr:hypothetical protein [Spirochaetota bacterium]
MKKFKPLFVFLLFFSMLFLLNCGGSSDDDDDIVDLPDPTNPVKTIMVYLDADNDLESYGLTDINEMEAVDLTGTDIKIIVLIDRHSGYSAIDGDWSGTRLYEIAYDSDGVDGTIDSTRLSSSELGLSSTGDSDELNMGDPSTLSKFINFCKSNYEGNYALILWNHGGGWRESNPVFEEPIITVDNLKTDKNNTNNSVVSKEVCIDLTDSDQLYMDEVQSAVKNKAITVIGFDACLMGMIEVAYEIRNYASYMIASEESEPGAGWAYDSWLASFKASTNKNAIDLCDAVVDSYETYYAGTPDTTLSAVNLSKIDTVFSALNNFSTALYNAITTDTIRDNVANSIINNVQNFRIDACGDDIHIDLWDLADEIQTEYNYCDSEAAALKTAVENAVVSEWHHSTDVSNSHGLAIFLAITEADCTIVNTYSAYLNGYSDTYPVDFVQNSNNTWVAHYSGGYIAGPGLLYRLLWETLP